MTDKVREKYPNAKTHVYPIRNDFFGERITVSGLITGRDIIKQLKGKKLGATLLLHVNMLRAGASVFLDDITVSELEEKLGVQVRITDAEGESFVRSVTGNEALPVNKRRQIYEQTDSSYSGQT